MPELDMSVWFVNTCRGLIDLSLIAGGRRRLADRFSGGAHCRKELQQQSPRYHWFQSG